MQRGKAHRMRRTTIDDGRDRIAPNHINPATHKDETLLRKIKHLRRYRNTRCEQGFTVWRSEDATSWSSALPSTVENRTMAVRSSASLAFSTSSSASTCVGAIGRAASAPARRPCKESRDSIVFGEGIYHSAHVVSCICRNLHPVWALAGAIISSRNTA
jgi:hypothetical protein